MRSATGWILRPSKREQLAAMPYNPIRALELLRLGTQNPAAAFRDGQEAAIQHVVDGVGRLLVVQRTGWGKSSVYFIATKLLREQGMGPAILISPLAGTDAESNRGGRAHGRSCRHHQLREQG